DPVCAMPANAIKMPHTVPNNPMNGEMLAVVARNGTQCSSLLTSTADARSSARSTADKLLRVGRPPGDCGLGPFEASAAGCRNWAVNSAYPDWNRPTSGLSTSDRQTACTSENL